jgi:short subunit dehydrogenase-like uncharacterized protein
MKYDVILYGATGFTGKRAVQYFKDHAPKSVKWAIAARNEAKLTALKQTLNLEVDILVADALQEAEIKILVQKTNVILSTAGPFALYGSALVKHCAALGVHYVDITGEAPWVRDMLDQHATSAAASGAKIIPFCGFDSIPADLGVWLLQDYFRESFQTELTQADAYYTLAKGGLNGGTFLSALNMMESGEVRRMGNPTLLLKNLEFRHFIPKIKRSVWQHYSEDLQKWVYPFFMAEINSKVVYRSIGLAAKYQLARPDQFVYQEYHAIGKRIPAFMAASSLVSFGLMGQSAMMRKLMRKWGPKSGDGPSEQNIEEGFFKLKMIGKDPNGNRAMMTLQYPGDAGNKATVCFLCESALALACNFDSLPNYTGFLTPSLAFGHVLLERLTKAGLKTSCSTLNNQ